MHLAQKDCLIQKKSANKFRRFVKFLTEFPISRIQQ